MSDDERFFSMSTIPPDISLLPPACEADLMVACMQSGGVPANQQAAAQSVLSLTHNINTGRTIVRNHMWLILIAFLHQVIGGCCWPVWTLMSHAPDHTHMWLCLTVVVLQLRKCLSPAWTLILPIRVHDHMCLHLTVVIPQLRKCLSPAWTLIPHIRVHNHMWLHLTVVVLQLRKCLLPSWTLILRIGVPSHMWLHFMAAVLLPHRFLWPAWTLIPPGGALFQVRACSLVLTLLMGR